MPRRWNMYGGTQLSVGREDMGDLAPEKPLVPGRVTAVVPAYNEAETIGDTIRALQAQTCGLEEIIVVDDCSTDGTDAVARALGVTVVRPPANTGSKAGAQTFGLSFVRTEFVVVIDADTFPEADAVEKLLEALGEPKVAAASGLVLPRYVRTIWERGRYVEYMLTFTFTRAVEEHLRRPLNCSGCFSIYRTQIVRRCGGWSDRTLTEDVDIAWTLYEVGASVRFIPEAIAYPVEPHTLKLMTRQLRRWSHGFLQNVRIHWRSVLRRPYHGIIVPLDLFDSLVLVPVALVTLLAFAIFVHPVLLLVYFLDLPVLAAPLLAKGAQRGEIGRVVLSLPGFYVLRLLRRLLFLWAAWMEFVVRRPLRVYEKGH